MRGMELSAYLEQLKSTALDLGEGPVVAYFDLDRTLIEGYSLTALAWQQLFNGIAPRRLVTLSYMFMKYALGRIGYDELLRGTVDDIRGMSEADLKSLIQQTYENRLVHAIYQEGYDVIKAHRRLGHHVVMVTSATSYQAEPIAEALRIPVENVCSTNLEVVDGCIAGGVEPCFGQGKVTAALAFANSVGGDLSRAYFYSDSKDDLPLLENVGRPVVVNGKSRLSKIGESRGWVSLEFNRTGTFGSQSQQAA